MAALKENNVKNRDHPYEHRRLLPPRPNGSTKRPAENTTRNGKVTRLPKPTRDLINHMLDDGLFDTAINALCNLSNPTLTLEKPCLDLLSVSPPAAFGCPSSRAPEAPSSQIKPDQAPKEIFNPEYPAAVYHVTTCGNRRKKMLLDICNTSHSKPNQRRATPSGKG